MKIIDKYILKTFLTTFLVVFVILVFIFVLQTVWLLIAELAGKDLDLGMIIQFLAYSMPRLTPLVLPLSILLASIMSFGDFSENYELAAMKSAGISLQRIFSPLIVFIFLLSISAFVFANNVIPFAEYKFVNFRQNIARAKPALAITEGQFSDVGLYNIKVNKKTGNNGNQLEGITIHKKGYGGDAGKILIKAKYGELISSEDSNILQLVLKEGNYYEDIIANNYAEQQKTPFIKSYFKRSVINIDLSDMNEAESTQGTTGDTSTMLTVSELNSSLDSLKPKLEKDIIIFSENINQRIIIGTLGNNAILKHNKEKRILPVKTDLLSLFSLEQQKQLLSIAKNNAMSIKYSVENSSLELKNKQLSINLHQIALHDKFVIAFGCFLMFFVGAPLGAIIRKGGLGLPVVFAVLIFISFHFINTFGRRISEEGGLTPFVGSWMGSFILSFLAVILTYRALRDMGFIIIDLRFLRFKELQKHIPFLKPISDNENN